MQIIITLKDTTHKAITTLNTISEHLQAEVVRAIKNGTTLPKGHGRLIDADKLFIDIEWSDIENAQTIIEADKEVENGN